METKKVPSFLRQSFHYLSSSILANTITFFTLPIFARYLSPADYGIIALFTTFGSVCAVFLSLGLSNATYRFYFTYLNEPREFKALNTTNFLFTVMVFVLFGFAVPFLDDFVATKIFSNEISADILMVAYVSGCLEYLLGYFSGVMTARGQSRILSSMTLIRMVVNTALSFYFIFAFKMTYMSRIYGLVISQMLALVILLYLCRDTLGMRLSLQLFKKSFKFACPQIPMTALNMVYTSLDKAMLAGMRGATAVGYYNFGEKFANLIKMGMDSIFQAWGPFFLEKMKIGDDAAKKQIVIRYFKLAFLFLLGGLGVAYFSEELIRLLTTPEYYPSMYVVPVYVYYYLTGVFAMLSVNQIMHAEKLHYQIPASLTSMALNLVLNILFIKWWGAVGAALATAISSLAASQVFMHFGFKFCPLPMKKSRIYGLFLIHCLFVAAVYPIIASEMHFLAKIAIKIGLMTGFVAIGARLGYVDIKEVRDFIMSRLPARLQKV